eukprot:4173914-Pyramimonas_sp.AAC.2
MNALLSSLLFSRGHAFPSRRFVVVRCGWRQEQTTVKLMPLVVAHTAASYMSHQPRYRLLLPFTAPHHFSKAMALLSEWAARAQEARHGSLSFFNPRDGVLFLLLTGHACTRKESALVQNAEGFNGLSSSASQLNNCQT